MQCVVCSQHETALKLLHISFHTKLKDHENSDSVNTGEGEKVKTRQALLEGRKEGLGDP